jgi:flagellar protein FliO/FliZ
MPRHLSILLAPMAAVALTLAAVAMPCARLSAVDPNSTQLLAPSPKTAAAASQSYAGNASSELHGPAILAVVAVIALCGYLVIRHFKNKYSGLAQSSQGSIQVCRSRSLGKGHFLVVVQVEGKRMLLGVGPTFINKLTDLEPEDFSIPFERKDGQPPRPQPDPPSTTPFSNLISRINESISPKGRDGGKKS